MYYNEVQSTDRKVTEIKNNIILVLKLGSICPSNIKIVSKEQINIEQKLNKSLNQVKASALNRRKQTGMKWTENLILFASNVDDLIIVRQQKKDAR